MGARAWIGRRIGDRSGLVTVAGGVGRGLVMGRALASAEYADGTNELAVQEAIRDSLVPGSVFYDVGANVGFFGLIAARIVGPTGAVYAFEPVAEVAAEARANAERNAIENLHVVEAAASDRTGRASLIVTRHPGGATLSGADAGDDATGTVGVATVRIDELVASGEIRPPDSVKIDVEGVELEVLDGMGDTLTRHRPVVVCELDAATAPGVEDKVGRVTERLEALGYGVSPLAPAYAGTGWHVVHVVATPR